MELLPAAFEVLRDYLARPGLGRWLILTVLAALSLLSLGEMFWPYRSLLLAGWAWLQAVSAVRKRLDRPRSSCLCQSTAWPG